MQSCKLCEEDSQSVVRRKHIPLSFKVDHPRDESLLLLPKNQLDNINYRELMQLSCVYERKYIKLLDVAIKIILPSLDPSTNTDSTLTQNEISAIFDSIMVR